MPNNFGHFSEILSNVLFLDHKILLFQDFVFLTGSGVARGGPSRAMPDQLCSSNCYLHTFTYMIPME